MDFVRLVTNKMNKMKIKLGELRKGHQAVIVDILPHEYDRRLCELGFLKGAQIEVLHRGAFGGNPLAVRVKGSTIALRKKEADYIQVEVHSDG
jgi:ferrous iron transport protein A